MGRPFAQLARPLAVVIAPALWACAGSTPTASEVPASGGLDVRRDVEVRDVTGLEGARASRFVTARSREDVVAAVRLAASLELGVAIAGARHSQGGHSSAEGQMVIDMTGMDRVLSVDPDEGTIRVEAGATWQAVQEAAHEQGLAVRVQQSSNVFTIGGSLSGNCHGRDIAYGPIVCSVHSFRLGCPRVIPVF